MKFFVPHVLGFYDDKIHGARTITVPDPAWVPAVGEDAPLIEVANPATRIPADAVSMTDEEHAALFAGQAAGKVIVVGPGGRPTTIDRPGPTVEQRWAAFQAKARVALDANDGVAVRCMKSGISYPQAWLDYDDALRSIVRSSAGAEPWVLPVQPAYPA